LEHLERAERRRLTRDGARHGPCCSRLAPPPCTIAWLASPTHPMCYELQYVSPRGSVTRHAAPYYQPCAPGRVWPLSALSCGELSQTQSVCRVCVPRYSVKSVNGSSLSVSLPARSCDGHRHGAHATWPMTWARSSCGTYMRTSQGAGTRPHRMRDRGPLRLRVLYGTVSLRHDDGLKVYSTGSNCK
jgi:hypothetical protein